MRKKFEDLKRERKNPFHSLLVFSLREEEEMSVLYEKSMQWFPSHMMKAIKTLESRLNNIDMVIEVRDARLPITSANSLIGNLCKKKKSQHVIVYNKSDLAHPLSIKVSLYLLLFNFLEYKKPLLFSE